MTTLKSLDCKVLLDKVQELGVDAKIDGLPLALYAADLSTLMALQKAGVDINPKRSQRGGHPSVIELAVRRYDAGSVYFCLNADNEPFEIEDSDWVGVVKAAVETCIDDHNREPLISNGFDFFVMKACVGAWSLSLDVSFEITKAMRLFDSRPRSRYHELIGIISGLLRILLLIQKDADCESTDLYQCAYRGFRKATASLIPKATEEERVQVFFAGAMRADAWMMKLALDQNEWLTIPEKSYDHLVDLVSRSPVDVFMCVTDPLYKIGQDKRFLSKLLTRIILRDRVDCLGLILNLRVSANAEIDHVPLMCLARMYSATNCFKKLLLSGAAPYYSYPTQYRFGMGNMRPVGDLMGGVSVEKDDIDFFNGTGEGSAGYLNDRALSFFLFK